MVRIIKTLDELGFDLATFMWHLSWSSTATTRDETIKYARTAFLHCDEFPLMLRKWRNGRAAAGTKGALVFPAPVGAIKTESSPKANASPTSP